MKTIMKIILLAMIFILTSLINISLADDDMAKPIKFELKIKPSQQYAKIKIEDDDKFFKTFNVKAEFIKLNPSTNNYHIKITFTNNGISTLYHQLALIEEVENSEIKFTNGTTDFIKYDDGKQITKSLFFYNYGNLKPFQSTPREWCVANTSKDEIEIKGYIINKEIPITLDPKIAAVNPGVAETLTKYIVALRDNDIDAMLAIVPKMNQYATEDLQEKYRNEYNNYPGSFSETYQCYINPTSVRVLTHIAYIDFNCILLTDGLSHLGSLEMQYDGTKWWITK